MFGYIIRGRSQIGWRILRARYDSEVETVRPCLLRDELSGEWRDIQNRASRFSGHAEKPAC